MKENRLISMVEFVDRQAENYENEHECFYFCVDYAKFLNQPLNIGQFVPAECVDGKWIVLEMPEYFDIYKIYTKEYLEGYVNPAPNFEALEQYQATLDKVIFEGFEYGFYHSFITNQKDDIMLHVESLHLSKIKDITDNKPTLTKYGQQQAGL